MDPKEESGGHPHALPQAAKHKDAFRTIGELSTELGVPQHILRYWETRFPQLRPLTRAGNRRYYRPEDVALVRRIDQALNRDGYTIKGVQKLLAGEGRGEPAGAVTADLEADPGGNPSAGKPHGASPFGNDADRAMLLARLVAIRDQLKTALANEGLSQGDFQSAGSG